MHENGKTYLSVQNELRRNRQRVVAQDQCDRVEECVQVDVVVEFYYTDVSVGRVARRYDQRTESDVATKLESTDR